MQNMEQLEKVAIADERWRTAAMSVLYEGEALEDQIDYHAEQIRVAAIIGGNDALQVLREHVGRANKLDHEAVEMHGADLSEGNTDVAERTARRIMHHAGRTALENVKTRKKRTAHHAKASCWRIGMLG